MEVVEKTKPSDVQPEVSEYGEVNKKHEKHGRTQSLLLHLAKKNIRHLMSIIFVFLKLQ